MVKKTTFIYENGSPIGIEKHMINSITKEIIILKAEKRMTYPEVSSSENQTEFLFRGITNDGVEVVEFGSVNLILNDSTEYINFSIKATQTIKTLFGEEKLESNSNLRFSKYIGWDHGVFTVNEESMKYELVETLNFEQYEKVVNTRNKK